MKWKNHRVACGRRSHHQAEFADLTPLRPGMAERVNILRATLLHHCRGEVVLRRKELRVRQAVSEAEALAWLTPFPDLFFSELAAEKVQRLRAWCQRQQKVLEDTAPAAQRMDRTKKRRLSLAPQKTK